MDIKFYFDWFCGISDFIQVPSICRKDSGGYMNATIMSSQKNTDEFWWYGLCTGFALDDVLKPTKVIAAWASFNLTQKRNVEYPLEEDMALQLKVENILTSVLIVN